MDRDRALSSLGAFFKRSGPRQDKNPSLGLHRGGIALAFVVDPAHLQIIALVAALEAELDIGVLGDRCAPIGDKNFLAIMFEGQFLDEMRRNEFAFIVLHET